MEIKKRRDSVTWRAAEHHHLEKSSGWYFVIGGVALLLLIIALIMKNFLFAILLVMAASLIMIFGSRPPAEYEFRVDEKGVRVGKKMRGYGEFSSFSVRKRNHEPREIVMRMKRKVDPFLHLPMERRTIADVHAILASKLTETEFDESLADILSDILGF